jgi:hypothetical protein
MDGCLCCVVQVYAHGREGKGRGSVYLFCAEADSELALAVVLALGRLDRVNHHRDDKPPVVLVYRKVVLVTCNVAAPTFLL